ncbi:MAG: efflux RND transporter permease subunit [Vulcanimicrobiaceae bacterium]
MIDFFLRRPVFAAVCSLLILLAGLVAIPTLPIAQFPQIAPPVVTVSAQYTGASAQTVETSVTTPLEEAINGVEGLRYITSTSGNDGSSTITCTFNLNRNLDIAATDVQNAVSTAQARLPSEVKLTGVTVSKNSGSFVMGIALTSHNASDTPLALSNYADLYIVDYLKRVKGVSNVIVFGERKYAMRLWLSPTKLAHYGLAASDVVSALSDQNAQVAAGSLGAPPYPKRQPYELSIRAVGRLTNAQQFNNMVLQSTPDGGHVRLKDVGYAELGAETYATSVRFDGRETVGLGVQALPSANALDVSRDVIAQMNQLAQSFPPGYYYKVAFDTTMFVHESINEVIITLLIAILLVIAVIFLFLQDWRTTLIPAVTIPVSLIGTFALMKVLGFSINTLTLFGITLATGLVVDDAIVVIENISRYINDKRMTPLAGASAAMREIFGAVVATSIVLLAVFVPVAFFPGTTGRLYQQFALTIACAVTISFFNAVTLTPALSALLLGRTKPPRGALFRAINYWIKAMRSGYHALIPRLIRWRWTIVALFAIALIATVFLFIKTPTAFTPDEDQGYFIVNVQAPEGVPLDYTEAVTQHVEHILHGFPEVADYFTVNGYGFNGNGSSNAIMFVLLTPWADRKSSQSSLNGILNRLYPKILSIPQALVLAFNPPAIQGVGSFGGFQFELEDKANVSLNTLARIAGGYIALGNQSPVLRNVFTQFRNDSPQLLVTIDRDKATSLDIPLASIASTMQVYLASQYVNDFDYLNRSWRVYVQAQPPYRSTLPNLQQLYVKSTTGAVTPLTTLVKTSMTRTAPLITHYNLFRSIEIDGQPAPGYGSGQAIREMQQLAARLNPRGVGYEWSGISLEQIESGSQTVLIFALGIIVVFLVLAAQYESFVDPLIILMAVPLAILGALIGLWMRGLQSDVYAQVGYVMLIGLASKNSILIVEFANQLRAQGISITAAARQAAETRLRPILMTSFAFILGVVPLVVATGAGAASRHSLGTVVFGGMIVSTILNLFIVPVLYVMIVSALERRGPPEPREDGTALAGGQAPPVETVASR